MNMPEVEDNEFTTGDNVALIALGLMGGLSLLCTLLIVFVGTEEGQGPTFELAPFLISPAAAGAAVAMMIWFRQRSKESEEVGWIVAAAILTMIGIVLSCTGISIAFSYDEPSNFLDTAIGSAVICVAPGVISLIIGLVLYFSKAFGGFSKDEPDDFFITS